MEKWKREEEFYRKKALEKEKEVRFFGITSQDKISEELRQVTSFFIEKINDLKDEITSLSFIVANYETKNRNLEETNERLEEEIILLKKKMRNLEISFNNKVSFDNEISRDKTDIFLYIARNSGLSVREILIQHRILIKETLNYPDFDVDTTCSYIIRFYELHQENFPCEPILTCKLISRVIEALNMYPNLSDSAALADLLIKLEFGMDGD